MSDPFDLARFLAAQAPVMDRVREELAAGRKRSHWMWFVFPQLRGLGESANAVRYGLSGLEEARAYLAHPVLGARLRDCIGLLARHPGRSPAEILGAVDAMKLRSCLTLFGAAAPADPVFAAALARHFGGEPDARTHALLGLASPPPRPAGA